MRCGNREGIGRFGMGMKMATLSVSHDGTLLAGEKRALASKTERIQLNCRTQYF